MLRTRKKILILFASFFILAGLFGVLYFSSLRAAISNGANALDLLGQISASDSPVWDAKADRSINAINLSSPQDTFVDTTNHRLFVSDMENNRVLVFNLNESNVLVDYTADYVLGQSNFSNTFSATTQAGLDGPRGLYFDFVANYLYVADSRNHRILVFDVASISNGESAINVLGQSNFTSSSSGTTQATLNSPNGLSYDDTNNLLFVADYANHRVMIFDVNIITDGENAVNVLGQTDFVSNTRSTPPTVSSITYPRDVDFDDSNNRLFVAESSRVTVFDTTTITNGEGAWYALGEESLTTETGASTGRDTLDDPRGVLYVSSNQRLYVTDTDNRILIFDVSTISTGEDAIYVLGQMDFVTSTGGTTQNKIDVYSSVLSYMGGLSYGASQIYFADERNNRVLVFDVSAIINGENAVNLAGHLDPNGDIDYTISHRYGNKGFYIPNISAVDEVNHRLFVVDSGNKRVLVFGLDVNNILTGYEAGAVLGQPNFNSIESVATSQSSLRYAQNLAYDSDGQRLFVSDTSANRILVFDVSAITNGENAVYVLGQDDFISSGAALTQDGLNAPTSMVYNYDRLFVNDSGNNRIVVFDVTDITNGENAVNVLGQTDFVSKTSGVSAGNLNMAWSSGLAYDSATDRLFVADGSNNRVLVFDVTSITNGEDAINVLGQTDFESNASGLSASDFNVPTGLAYDQTYDRLFVSDSSNHRVLQFNVENIANGKDAAYVIGQNDFVTGTSGLARNKLYAPLTLAYEHISGQLMVGESVNYRITFFDADLDPLADIIAPTLTETTPVPTPSNDTTPSYTFNSSEAGTISYEGSCSSVTTEAVAGDNTITFNELAVGTYNDCRILVTDSATNTSAPLTVTEFVVEAEAVEIVFDDPNFEACVRTAISILEPTPIMDTDVDDVINLSCMYGSNVADLTGIEYFTSLQMLNVVATTVSDLTPLSGLTNLTNLSVYGGMVSDLSPISDLTGLTSIDFYNNEIVDVSPLSGLINLTNLRLCNNNILSLSSLSGLTALIEFSVARNYNISDISVLENMLSVATLGLGYNNISDISVLSERLNLTALDLSFNDLEDADMGVIASLEGMTFLVLSGNNITDITALAGLDNLYNLSLTDMLITDIGALVDNVGLIGEFDYVYLYGNPLSISAIGDITTLEARDVNVSWDRLCGNSIIEDLEGEGEECDDGDNDNGDGCNYVCEVEENWQCAGEPSVCETVPAAPTNCIISGVGTDSLDVIWEDNASNEVNYVVENSVNASDYAVLTNTLPPGSEIYNVSGLTESTRYWFRVKATNAVGGSTYSLCDVAETLGPPLAPTSCSASTAVDRNSITVRWEDNSDSEANYVVEHSTDDIEYFVLSNTILPNRTVYAVNNLPLNTDNHSDHYFRVKATNGYGDSSYSECIPSSTSNSNKTAPYRFYDYFYTPLEDYQMTPQGIARDSNGNLFVVDTLNAKIKKFDANFNFVMEWDRPGSGYYLAIDDNDVLYYPGDTSVYKYDVNGTLLGTFLCEGTCTKGVAVDESGDIYVTSSNYVKKFTNTGTLLLSFTSDFNGAHGIGVDGDGNIYVNDEVNTQKFDSIGTYLTEMPIGSWNIYVDTDGNIYTGGNKYDSTGTFIMSYDAGNSTSVTLDSDGNIYSAGGNYNYEVREYDSLGTFIDAFGSEAYSLNGQFAGASGIGLDGSGNIYVNDENGVQIFDANGDFSSALGIGGYDITVDDSGNIYTYGYKYNNLGTLLLTYDVGASSTALDSSDNIYAAGGFTHNSIRKYNTVGTLLAEFGETGSDPGQFNMPLGIALDSFGNIYVHDLGNSRIQKFDSSYNYIKEWAVSGSGYYIEIFDDIIYYPDGGSIQMYDLDGNNVASVLCAINSCARGVAFDADRNMYVTNSLGILKYETNWNTDFLYSGSAATKSKALAKAPNGNLGVVYEIGEAGDQLEFLELVGGNWTNPAVFDLTYTQTESHALTYSSENYPYVSYFNWPTEIYYRDFVEFNASVPEFSNTENASYDTNNAFALTKSYMINDPAPNWYGGSEFIAGDTPALVYHKSAENALKFAIYLGGSGNCGQDNLWFCETVKVMDPLSDNNKVSLAFSSDNVPGVALIDKTGYLYYLEKVSGVNTWTQELIDETNPSYSYDGTFGQPVNLVFDNEDNPMIVYTVFTTIPTGFKQLPNDAVVKVAKKIEGVWSIETVDKGGFANLSKMPNGIPVVSYTTSGLAIKYAARDANLPAPWSTDSGSGCSPQDEDWNCSTTGFSSRSSDVPLIAFNASNVNLPETFYYTPGIFYEEASAGGNKTVNFSYYNNYQELYAPEVSNLVITPEAGPLFSWSYTDENVGEEQARIQIQVSTTDANDGDICSSGEVVTTDKFITYQDAGCLTELTPSETYYFSLTASNSGGVVSAYATPVSFIAAEEEASEIVFTDENFEACVRDELGIEEPTPITPIDALTLTSLRCQFRDIVDLVGLEYFTNLTRLQIDYSELTSVDLSANINLEVVDLSNNNINEINVLSNTLLEVLILSYNDLTTIDLSGNPELRILSIADNNLSELDVSGNMNLDAFFAGDNNISSIDLSSNPAVTYLNFTNNDLTEIDLSSLNLLRILDLSNNPLTSLDLSNNVDLTELYFNGNNFNSLDLTNNVNLRWLYLSDNDFTDVESLIAPLLNPYNIDLSYNNVVSLTPFINHPGISDGDILVLSGNPLNSYSDIQTLEAEGVTVTFDIACGDDELAPAAGEQCDDGNNEDGDGCSAICQIEAGGTGTEEDPYQITNCAELQTMNADLDAYYELVTDIDCSESISWNGGQGFEPIGSTATPFTGYLYGMGNSISDLYIDRAGSDTVGLFGALNVNAVILGLGLENVSITGNNNVGALVGSYIGGAGAVFSVYSSGNVVGNGSVGGLIGLSEGNVALAYSTCTVSGVAGVGGLIGANSGRIENTYAQGFVTGVTEGSFGGLVGYNTNLIINSYSIGAVSAGGGGLVGLNAFSVADSFWDIESSGQVSSSGGTGQTTAQMQTQSTFTNVGWDYDSVWEYYVGNYPKLLFLVSDDPVGSATIVNFVDTDLETCVRTALDISEPTPITSDDALTLTSLGCSYDNIVDLDGLEYFLNLVTLDLQGNPVVDVAPISGLTSLRTLNLLNTEIEDISSLSALTSLTWFGFGGSYLTEDFSVISNFTSLTFLNLTNNIIGDLNFITGLSNLTSLQLVNDSIQDITELADLDSVQTLVLTNNQITDSAPLSGMTSLQYLTINDNSLSSLSGITSLTGIIMISAADNELTSLSGFSSLTNLTYLDVRNNSLDDVPQLEYLTALSTAFLQDNEITDIGPLVANSNFADSCTVDLTGNYINSYADIGILLAREVDVTYDYACGDTELEEVAGEECDDGNNEDGDGCSALCVDEGPVCGNGIVETEESCDDGNLVNGDGCSDVCRREGGSGPPPADPDPEPDPLPVAAPTVPTAQPPTVLSSSSIQWNFLDRATNEVGFKLYDANSVLLVTSAVPDLNNFVETGLNPNTQYSRQVSAYHSSSESPLVSVGTVYTLANKPSIDTLIVTGEGAVALSIATSGNPSNTTYSIYEVSVNKWVQANGTLGPTAVYQTNEQWLNGAAGIPVTGLTPNALYLFQVQARNGDGVLTSFSETKQIVVTRPVNANIVLTKKVGVNVSDEVSSLTWGRNVFAGVDNVFQINFSSWSDKYINVYSLSLLALILLFPASLFVAKKYTFKYSQKVYRIAFSWPTKAVVAAVVVLLAYNTFQVQAFENQSGADVETGDELTYQVSYTNSGGQTARNVIVSDSIPDGITYVAGTLTSTGNKCVLTNKLITCNLGDLAPSASGVLEFTASVTGSSGSTIINIASATYTGGTANSNSTTNDIVAATIDCASGQTCDVVLGAGWNYFTVGINSVLRFSYLGGTHSAQLTALNAVAQTGTLVVSSDPITSNLVEGNVVAIDVNGNGYNDLEIQIQDIESNQLGTIGLQKKDEVVLVCGDKICNNNETCDTCPSDCGACLKAQCEDSVDNDNDGFVDFPADIGCTSAKDNDESNIILPVCGDNLCNGAETCKTCAGDCGKCPVEAVCGDNSCNGTETCNSCALDCGACPDQDLPDEVDEPTDQPQEEPTEDSEESGSVKRACSDNLDNDGDNKIDMDDPGCVNLVDDDETDVVLSEEEAKEQVKVIEDIKITKEAEKVVESKNVAAVVNTVSSILSGLTNNDYEQAQKKVKETVIATVKTAKIVGNATINNPTVEKVNNVVQEPVTVMATAASVASVATVGATGAAGVGFLTYLQFLFTQPILLLTRRRRQNWGIVYNSITKKPLDLAIVRLFDANTNRLVTTRVTDRKGRYQFMAKPGRYYLEIGKKEHRFPSDVINQLLGLHLGKNEQVQLNENVIDGEYQNLYNGGTIEIKPGESGIINRSVPVDPDKKLESDREVLKRLLLKRLQTIATLLGPIIAIVSYIIDPQGWIGILVILQIVMYFVFRRLAKIHRPLSWGSVKDIITGKKLHKVVVRVFDTRFNKLLDTQVTDSDGKYGFLVSRGEYYLTGNRQNYEPFKSNHLDLTQVDSGYIAEEIKLKPVNQNNDSIANQETLTSQVSSAAIILPSVEEPTIQVPEEKVAEAVVTEVVAPPETSQVAPMAAPAATSEVVASKTQSQVIPPNLPVVKTVVNNNLKSFNQLKDQLNNSDLLPDEQHTAGTDKEDYYDLDVLGK